MALDERTTLLKTWNYYFFTVVYHCVFHPRSMGFKRPRVRISALGPNNDDPNYIIQAGNVFGFIISFDNVI